MYRQTGKVNKNNTIRVYHNLMAKQRINTEPSHKNKKEKISNTESATLNKGTLLPKIQLPDKPNLSAIQSPSKLQLNAQSKRSQEIKKETATIESLRSQFEAYSNRKVSELGKMHEYSERVVPKKELVPDITKTNEIKFLNFQPIRSQKNHMSNIKRKLKTLETLQTQFLPRRMISNIECPPETSQYENQFLQPDSQFETPKIKRKNNSPEKALIRGLKIGLPKPKINEYPSASQKALPDQLSNLEFSFHKQKQNNSQANKTKGCSVNILKIQENQIEATRKGEWTEEKKQTRKLNNILNCVDGFTTFGPSKNV